MHFYTSMNLPTHVMDVLWYLAPSLGLAVVIRGISGRIWLFSLLTLTGTLCHELAHFLIGFITNAKPVKFDLIPRRLRRTTYQMGAVAFANIRWYNAAPTALAPLLVLAVPYLVAAWRLRSYVSFDPIDVGLMFVVAPQFLSFWPSLTDWKMALRSWPYIVGCCCVYWFLN